MLSSKLYFTKMFIFLLISSICHMVVILMNTKYINYKRLDLQIQALFFMTNMVQGLNLYQYK